MNTLITGGSGLLGSFCDFGKKPSKQELDILCYKDLLRYIKENDIKKIVHTAAKVGGVKINQEKVFDFFSENLVMTINVLNACKEMQIEKVIFILSTCAFPQNARLPLQNQDLHQGEPHFTNYGYAYAKRMAEVGVRAIRQQYLCDALCITPCNMYGENDNYNLQSGHVISSLIHKCYLAKKNKQTLEIWGSGKAEREFIYAKDVASIIKDIINENQQFDENIIVSPDVTYSIENLAFLIARLMNFSGKIIFDNSKPEGILKKNSDNTKFKKYFPNMRLTALEDGLQRTIEYFIKNYENVRK